MKVLPLLLVTFCATAAPVDPLAQWGQWRGPLSTGVAPKADPPTKWDKETNIRWKARISGQGHSSPVVWGDNVFLTTAEAVGEKLAVPKQPAGAHNNIDPDHKMLFQVIAISVDAEEDRDYARERLQELTGGVLDFYFAPPDRWDIVYDSGARGFPTTVIYDETGAEIARLSGEADWESYEAAALIDAIKD